MSEMQNTSSEMSLSGDDTMDENAMRYSPAFARPSVPPPSFSGRRFESSPPPSSRQRSEEARSVRARDESGGDSMLSRYFRDMATHQVMGPDEELKAARMVESAIS